MLNFLKKPLLRRGVVLLLPPPLYDDMIIPET